MQIPFIQSRIQPDESSKFWLLAILLLFNSMVIASNEVIATSGFASRVGMEQLLWLWAIDMLIVMATSAFYSLWVDRHERSKLTIVILILLALAYLLLFSAFSLGIPTWISYSIFTILTDQQWILIPMLIWAMTTDVFSTTAVKRIIPLLSVAVLVGKLLGNSLIAALATVLSNQQIGSETFLVVNSLILFALAILLTVSRQKIRLHARQSISETSILEDLREGIKFVRDVPAYRYLSIAMVLLGFGFNILEFHFLLRASQIFASPLALLETFYGSFKVISIILLAITQGIIATKLLERMGFERIFGIMPITIVGGIFVVLLWPGVYAIALGNMLARVVLMGIDEPARHAFQGLVPDERRGRVIAVMDGYLYPAGSIISCGVILLILYLAKIPTFAFLPPATIYLLLGLICAIFAFYATYRLQATYAESMLNWRLQRKRRASQIVNLDF